VRAKVLIGLATTGVDVGVFVGLSLGGADRAGIGVALAVGDLVGLAVGVLFGV
jgi:hypothetical protein